MYNVNKLLIKLMAFRKKLLNRMKTPINRAKKTRLYVIETGKWAAGNASALMDLLSTGVRTAASSVSARNAAVDITNGIEDYACSDYKCLILDTTAAACDLTAAVASFIPGNATKKVFGITTSASCFCRTLRNKCKETNAFGCK
jgi:hypothetical protein